jgi:hypothetical protein
MGADRKPSAHGQSDAIDPDQTSGHCKSYRPNLDEIHESPSKLMVIRPVKRLLMPTGCDGEIISVFVASTIIAYRHFPDLALGEFA